LGIGFKQIYDVLGEYATKEEIPKDAMIENHKEIIETIIADKSLYEWFKKLNETNINLNEKINKFDRGLRGIVHDFNKKHIPLKGSCEDCKDWLDELDSLK